MSPAAGSQSQPQSETSVLLESQGRKNGYAAGDSQTLRSNRAWAYFKVAPLPRDRFALQSGKQFGVMSVDILAEIRNAVIDPGCQISDVNG
jgi:hypothetical protein